MNAGGMDDTGSSPCQLISPKIDFLSPWKEQGHIEVVAGIEGPGSGSIRLCRGDDDIPALSSVTLVPFKDIGKSAAVQPILLGRDSRLIEQVIITYKSIEMFQVIMVPKAASGASSLTREEPQIIQFKWPDRKANDQLKGQAGEKADRESDTYSSVLKSVFDEQLAAFDKEVVVYTEQTQLEADPSIFATEAHLGPVTLSSMKGKLKK